MEAESGVVLDGTVAEKVIDLETAIEDKEIEVAILNEAWEAFIP